MNNGSRSILTTIIVIAISIALVSIPVYAGSVDDRIENEGLEREIIKYAENWLIDNYDEFYNIRNLQSSLIDIDDCKETVDYTIALSCETNYKITKVEDIPLIKGVIYYVENNDLSLEPERAINEFIDNIKTDAFSEEWVGLNVNVVVRISKSNNSLSWELLYDDGLTNELRDVDELALNYDDLYNLGYKTAEEIVSGGLPEAQGTDTYNKTLARNYSRQYTSNPSTCDVHGYSCGTLQNRAYWNTSQYPNFSVFNDNDCADFVSQALSRGGIPEVTGSSGWYRTKYASSGTPWSINWTVVSYLTSYMTSHSYFTSTTYANCLAGEVMTTNYGGHVVMVDYNDGTTHRFNGHTNDRYQYAFSNYAGSAYYKVHRWEYPVS